MRTKLIGSREPVYNGIFGVELPAMEVDDFNPECYGLFAVLSIRYVYRVSQHTSGEGFQSQYIQRVEGCRLQVLA